jgi:4-hydroxybenzoate polyprenyltransferase
VAATRDATSPASGFALIPALLGLVRFSHTVFALPFALAGALLARLEWPTLATLWWILVAMVGARSLAMALNRLIDADIDAKNPRTASRELPAGRLTGSQVVVFSAVSFGLLLLAVSQLPPLTWVLWPIPVIAFVLYPYTKRITWLCHLALGLTIGLAPMGAWIAVTGSIAPAAVLLWLAVAAWIAGFDIIYALLDIDFDRANGIRSVPARFGPDAALWITRLLHVVAIILLAAAGVAAGAGIIYQVGVVACAVVLAYENATVDPKDEAKIQAAFGNANMLMATLFAVFVIAEVSFS